MKKYSILMVCLVISLAAMAAKPVISFQEKVYDFGKIYEKNGSVTHVFDFVNKGNAPLVVTKVQTSCGCTTPSWTKEPVEAGKKGSITVTFNPAGKSNAFTKTITVYSNDSTNQTVLIVKGEITPKEAAKN